MKLWKATNAMPPSTQVKNIFKFVEKNQQKKPVDHPLSSFGLPLGKFLRTPLRQAYFNAPERLR